MPVASRLFAAALLALLPALSPAQDLPSSRRAAAADLAPPAEIAGDDWSGAGRSLAAAERVETLVRTTRAVEVEPGFSPDSDLRVSLIVLHAGPATDVSPRYELHLAMFNVLAEWGTAWSLVPLASAWRVGQARREAAGLYTVEIDHLTHEDGCIARRSLLRIDARALSSIVRRAEGLEQLDARRYRAPVGLVLEPGPCVGLSD